MRPSILPPMAMGTSVVTHRVVGGSVFADEPCECAWAAHRLRPVHVSVLGRSFARAAYTPAVDASGVLNTSHVAR
jgi:hypothetical protein